MTKGRFGSGSHNDTTCGSGTTFTTRFLDEHFRRRGYVFVVVIVFIVLVTVVMFFVNVVVVVNVVLMVAARNIARPEQAHFGDATQSWAKLRPSCR